MIDEDEKPKGLLLTRREILGLFGAAGAALVIACTDDKASSPATPSSGAGQAAGETQPVATATAAAAAAIPSCIVRPALTEGPYFVDEKLNRSDIRSDPSDNSVRPGVPLSLTFAVSRVASNACSPLANATVDVWHCDALGVYSDSRDAGFNTIGKKFLRGSQVTDASGKAQFTTIYPGWYQGRAVHIHFKIRTNNSEFTSQLFFNDALSDQIYAAAPYSQKGVSGKLANSRDDIFRQSNGQLTLQPAKSGDGYAAAFDIGLQSA